MADHFRFELVSPAKLLLSADATSVVVPGSEGDFGVLPNHAPVLSTLRPGVLEIQLADGKHERIFVRGGFAEVDPASLTILAQEAINLDEMDREWLGEQIRNAEEDVNDAKDDDMRMHAQVGLDKLREIQAAL